VVAAPFPDGADVVAALEHVGREGVVQRVGGRTGACEAGLADAVEESRLARTGRASLMDGRNSRGCLMLRNNKPIRGIEQADACRLRGLEHTAHGESQAPRAVAMAGAGGGPIAGLVPETNVQPAGAVPQ
jgi:hypothetical protein